MSRNSRRATTLGALVLAALLSSASTRADDAQPELKPVQIPDAASLIGRRLDGDLAYAISLQAKSSPSGDWLYGFSGDPEGGLTRGAWTSSVGKVGAIRIDFPYFERCRHADKAVRINLEDSKRFKVVTARDARGATTDSALAWIVYGDHGRFDAAAKRQRMILQGIDGAFVFELDRDAMKTRGLLALCPAETAPENVTKSCAVFSLKGFGRAFDFACDAK